MLVKLKLQIDQDNLKTTYGRNMTSKSKFDRIVFRDTDTIETKNVEKFIHPKREKTSDIFIVCLRVGLVLTCLRFNLSSAMETASSTGGEYFTSVVMMKQLARFEQSVVAEMRDIVNNFNTADSSESLLIDELPKIELYLEDYDSSFQPVLLSTKSVEEAVVSHPLISYRTIRRMVVNLPEILKYKEGGRLKKLSEVAALIEPEVTSDDMIGAIEGVLRLHITFSISPYDFAHGRLQNFETKSGLTATDCFLIGQYALKYTQQPSTAVEWLVQALRMLLPSEVDESKGNKVTIGDDVISIHTAREGLKSIIDVHNQVINQNLEQQKPENKNPWTFGRAVDIKLCEMTRDNEEELVAQLPAKPSLHPSMHGYELFHQEDNSKYDDINFKRLCRGDKLRNGTLTKNLKCYYKTDSPFLAIKPLKVEVHSHDPLILQFYDILPDFIIKHFINVTSNQLKRALVASDEGKKPSKARISCNLWLYNEKMDEILRKVPKIIHEATELNLIPQNASESSQIAAYGAIGGFFAQHFDILHDSKSYDFKTSDYAEKNRGDRIATIMFYLSDLKLGGGTAFPRIGVLAEPVKGSAVFWYNLKKNGRRDDFTLHGGCPVLLGEKWVMNKWIRSGDQMFVRKCSLDQNM